MKLNRIELKKIMYDYNSISNRLLQADFNDYIDVLSKFMAYIQENRLILDYVTGCGVSDQDIAEEFNQVSSSYGQAIFSLGNSEIEEVRNIFGILCYIVDNKIEIHYEIASAYSYSTKFQDRIRSFNDRVVMVLIRHIERYLTKIGIDMGMDDKNVYSITVTNGQVNIANDSSIINNTINHGFDITQLSVLIQAIKDETEFLSDKDRETVLSSLEVIEQELHTKRPRKSFINTAISGIKSIKGTAEFTAAVVAIIQFVQGLNL